LADKDADRIRKQYMSGFTWTAQHIAIGKLIKEGKLRQAAIARETGYPLSTVGRVKRCMDYGAELPVDDIAQSIKPLDVVEQAEQIVQGGVAEPNEGMPSRPPVTNKAKAPPPDSKAKISKPVLPEEKTWHKSNGDTPTDESDAVAESEEDDTKPTKEPGGPVTKEKVMVGSLFENVVKVRLKVGNLLWYHIARSDYGYPGTIEEYINDCIEECAAARGLSLTVTRKDTMSDQNNHSGGK
jgi:hypothetical protein